MTVFEMEMDIEYVRLMLMYFQAFHQRFVAGSAATCIPENVFFDEPEYKVLLQKTLDLYHSCKVIETINDPAKSEEHLRLFLDHEEALVNGQVNV